MSQAQTKLQSLTTKLNSAQALVAKYTAEIAGLTRFAEVKVGDIVGFEFGRGEGKQNLQGEVVARGKLDNGVEVVNVLVGKGTLDADIKRIPLSTLNAHVPAASTFTPPVEQTAQPEADPLGSVVTSEPVVNGDPLADTAVVRNLDDLIS